MNDLANDGRRIRALRILRGWKQADLASAAQVGRKTVSRAELGFPLTRSARAAIMRALDEQPGELPAALGH